MKILVIHQNFPGQYKHLAPALVRAGHEVVALTLRVEKPVVWNGVRLIPYTLGESRKQQTHPWVLDFDSKVTRGGACFQAARALRSQGYTPDVILAHPGWGEALFLGDVWPNARIGVYSELYHIDGYPHVGFDPEFPVRDPEADRVRLRLKNLYNHLQFDAADMGISPTRFQADTFPQPLRDKITVIHDGIDTAALVPWPEATYTLPNGRVLSRADEVITFVNRNLEPYRGYHVFMRALPELLRRRPNAQILVVGGDSVSYGAQPPAGKTWKQIFIDEVRGQISDEDWARVHYLGRIPYDKFTAMLQLSRAHIYLTYPFVLSWSMLETMSVGGALVASSTDPVKEVLTDGENGLLVDFFDGKGLVDRVEELLDDEGLRRRLGMAARDFVTSGYDLNRHCLPRQMEWVNALAQARG
ncbi:glycosyltransferase family 4 protein [Pseudooceanicola nanhaiensis]|uniref:glycosyltransferase family 4 protein n=1 Tax=Pseudooceanicola nanhaiensis TaxID=375761 RepID=UPI001CD30E4B|nr:glycosyltransferase family 4 protein [Pseudooceanicola nanhaiensis]MCA0918862.1 glycosyltransferase family 4 protein [Pseudooceanicola nanhaiensis]